MKNPLNLGICALLTTITVCSAQQMGTIPAPTPYSVVHREANERILQSTQYETLPSGQTIPHVQRYEELGSGLCYIGPNGQWLDSQEIITLLPDGSAAATNGQSQVFFPVDIATGTVRLITPAPNSLGLQSRPISISYSDGTTSVTIASLTNSVGELISSNEVLYPSALVGAGITCDVLYEYRSSGLEQDVIFRTRPPDPGKLGLNAANSKVQVASIFFNPPSPAETGEAVNPQTGLADTTLTFGCMKMIQGRAFLTGDSSGTQIPTFKSWVAINATSAALIEQLPYSQIRASLATLPNAVAATPTKSAIRKVAFKRPLPPARLLHAGTNIVQMSRASIGREQGFCLDYIAINGDETNFVFQGDSTYYLSSPCYLYGNTVIEGGTTVKMSGSGQLVVEANGTVDCQTTPYLPALFTSYNDNAVGDWFGNGSPAMGDVTTFLNFYSTNVVLHDLHFAYASKAVNQTTPGYASSINLWDCEFVNVGTAVDAYNIGLYNVLIGRNVLTNAVILEGTNLVGENVTADYGSAFIQATNSGTTIALTNCLITSQSLLTASSSVSLHTNAVVCLPSPSLPVYQVVGAGNYYLTNSSPYASEGTLNINPDLLADLQGKTVWPPIVYADTNISSLGTLSPAVVRDNNSSLAIGFHYDPLDYVFGGDDLYSNLTITMGTAVGWFEENGNVNVSGQPYAVTLNNGANVSFNGDATQPCYWSQYAMVQERGNNNWNSNSGYMAPFTFNGSSSSQEPLLSADFTEFTEGDIGGFLRDNSDLGEAEFKNCEFYNLAMDTYDMQYLTFTNCLFFRDMIVTWDTDNALNFTNENCTYYNGGLALARLNGQAAYWLIENTIFDGTALAWNDSLSATTNILFNYNAYNTNNLSWSSYSIPDFTSYGTNEVVGANDLLTTNYDWESSWFGNFYLPTNSPLIQEGSTNANLLGLYHFTTQTNQTIEGTNRVTIGYHYVATDANGDPLDSNGDGIPDYLEDPLGNGLPYDGTNWALAILIQPTNEIAIQGANITLNVTAGGVPTLSYQWYFNSNLLSGATSAALAFNSVQTNSAGNYFVVVTNNFGVVTSSIATLIIVSPPSVSITNPVNNEVIIASQTNVTLMAVASDFSGIVTQVQFFEGTSNLGTVTSSPYNFVWTNAPAGNYALTAIAENNYGLVSTSAVVNVFISPLFATNNLLLWLKADAITGVTNNGSIGIWPDSSGRTNNATQGTVGNRPLYFTNTLNGLPVVQFNGANSYFTLPNLMNGTTGAEAFVVLKAAVAAPPSLNYGLWSLSSSFEAYPGTGGIIWESFGSTTYHEAGIPVQPITACHVLEVSAKTGNWELWINGILQCQTLVNSYGYYASPQLGSSAVSGGGYFNGFIAEVLIFNRPLISGERSTVNTYLNGKYGLVPPVPAAPTNLVATPISPTQVGLTWSEVLTNAGVTQIAIERGTNSNGPFTVVAEVPNQLSYVDTNLTSGTTYYYQVQAVNLTQLSPASNVAQATTPANGASMPLASLILWLKADSGLLQGTTNVPVLLWADQSGNGNDATQITVADRPLWVSGGLNNLPVVQFNGTNSYFNLPNLMNGTTGAEAFVVLKAAVAVPPTLNYGLWSLSSQFEAYPGSSGNVFESFGSSTWHEVGLPSQPITAYHVLEVTGQTGNWELWINQILQLQANNNTYQSNASPQLGVNSSVNYFYGNIAEVLIFNRPLISGERATVNTYLNGKYALVPPLAVAPTNLVATPISPTQVGLTWSEVLTNAGVTQIAIERSTNSNGPFTVVAEVPNQLSYVDTNLTSGTTYYYQVQAVNLTQLSPVSNVAQATTPANGASMPLASLILWLKADSGLLQGTTNVPVLLWADQSGNGNDATQITVADRPLWVSGGLNNLPVVQFNGTNSYFNLPNLMNGTTGAEAFVVLKAAVAAPPSLNYGLWSLSTPFEAYPGTGGTIWESFGSTSYYRVGMPSQPLNAYHVLEVSAQTGNWELRINGVLQYQTNNNTYTYNTSPELGVDYNGIYFDGDIAEILIFNRGLTADEKVAVGGYLFSKYGLEQFATNAVAPGSPTNVIAVGTSPNELNLQWDATSTNTTGFIVERKLGTNGVYQEIGSAISTNFLDTGVYSANQYFYEVKAENFFGESGYSGDASPPVPTVTLLSTNEYILAGATNQLLVQALDANYPIDQATVTSSFNIGTIGSSASVPCTNSWVPIFPAVYALSATATDTQGNSWVSPPLTVPVYLSSNTNGIPNYLLVEQGNDPLNPWLPPAGDTNTSPPIINLVVPANAVLLP